MRIQVLSDLFCKLYWFTYRRELLDLINPWSSTGGLFFLD